MITPEQNDRFFQLTEVLQYASVKTALLTVEEKILIHQERAYWLNQLNPPELQTIRKYKVPENIEKKIQIIVKLIKQSEWN
ncbi:MAG: hypothetical protein AB7D46_00675 [Flavobacteriaceae bacterium]